MGRKKKYTEEHEFWLLKNHNNETVPRIRKRMQKAFPNDNVCYEWIRTTLIKNGLGKPLAYKTANMEKFVRAVWDPDIMSISRCAKMCSEYFGVSLTRPGLHNYLVKLGLPLESGNYSQSSKANTILRRGAYLSRVDFRSYTKEQQQIIRQRASSAYTVWYIDRSLKTLLENNVTIKPDNVIRHLNNDVTDDRLENLKVISSNTVHLAALKLTGYTTGDTLPVDLVDTSIDVAEVLNVGET